MKLHPKALTADKVQKKLKRAAEKLNEKRKADRKKHPWVGEQKPVSYRTVCTGYKVKLNFFSGKRWSFDPEFLYSASYAWWPMLKVVKGKLVRNDYGYSPQTAQHQRTLTNILRTLGIKPDVELNVRSSINDLSRVKSEIFSAWAEEEIRLKYQRKSTRKYRSRYIKSNIKALEKLGVRFSQKAKKEALVQAERARRNRLDAQKATRQWRKERDAALVKALSKPVLSLVLDPADDTTIPF